MPKGEIIIDIQDHGFRPQSLQPEHYMLGASKYANAPIINPSGDWSAYKPERELQNKNGLETYNCTNYGSHNALETLGTFHKFEDFPTNCSERYSGVGTGTTEGGNQPHDVIEKIRLDIGAIEESFLPFSEDVRTWSQYYSPSPLSADLLARGRKLLKKFKIGHDWIFVMQGTVAQKHEKLEYSLKRGTVCVSVLAWKKNGDIYFKEQGEGDNHWVQLLRRNPDGTWKVYDHYDQVEKDLAADYDFGFAKVYYLERLSLAELQQKKSLLEKATGALIELLKKFAEVLNGKASI